MCLLGNPAKPAKQLKIGDVIEIEYSNRVEKVEVIVIPTGNVRRAGSIGACTKL